MSCREIRTSRYSRSRDHPTRNTNNNHDKVPTNEECPTCPSSDNSPRKIRVKKPSFDLVSTASKVSKPIFNDSHQNKLKPFTFDEDIRPWINNYETEF